MIQAKGNGQSECFQCKKEGKWSLTWTSFLFKIANDNYTNLYCYHCAKKIEKREGVYKYG